MPLVIKESSLVPPGGGYIMKHPLSEAIFKRHYVDGVIKLYLDHCEANGYPLPTQRECIDIICKSTPANICYDSDEPPFVVKAINYVGALARAAARGFQTVSQEVLDARLAICQECTYWGGTTGGELVSARCGKCGCGGKKLGWPAEKCPIGKWSAV